MKKYTPIIVISIITVLSYLITKNPLTKTFSVQILLLSILILVGYTFYAKRNGKKATETPVFLYLASLCILLLVGATGWFFSPFFFMLYLMTIFYAFVFTSLTAGIFAAILIAFFSFNIGEVDVTYDLLVVLSLLTSIPLSIYLRKEYLALREKANEILILRKEYEEYHSKIEEVMANKIIDFATTIREPINDVKQLSYGFDDVKDKTKMKNYEDRIRKASERALDMLADFEEEATGKKLLSTPKAQATPRTS